mgnify:CR=1 FL=1
MALALESLTSTKLLGIPVDWAFGPASVGSFGSP